jgi:hypothetical protein
MYQDAGSGMPAAPKKKGGCLKWGGIGCAVIVVLLVILLVGLYTQRHKFLNWAGEKMKAEILKALPEEFNQAEATEVMEGFWIALKEERINEADVQQLVNRFQTAYQDGALSTEEAEELLDFMREKAGIEPPAEVEPPYEEEGWEDDVPAETAEEPAGDGTEL